MKIVADTEENNNRTQLATFNSLKEEKCSFVPQDSVFTILKRFERFDVSIPVGADSRDRSAIYFVSTQMSERESILTPALQFRYVVLKGIEVTAEQRCAFYSMRATFKALKCV